MGPNWKKGLEQAPLLQVGHECVQSQHPGTPCDGPGTAKTARRAKGWPRFSSSQRATGALAAAADHRSSSARVRAVLAVFILQTLALEAFGIYWVVKGEALLGDEPAD